MKVLGLDTSNKFLIISLIENDEVVFFERSEVYRNASEITNEKIAIAFRENGWKPADLDAVVVTRGPGSFTGIRIAMSIAKVMCTTLDIPLYSLSSMHYYAGLDDTAVILDARSNKVYIGHYKGGETLSEGMSLIDEIEITDKMIGELSVFELDDKYNDLKNNFLLLKPYWKLESALHAKPVYYKDNI